MAQVRLRILNLKPLRVTVDPVIKLRLCHSRLLRLSHQPSVLSYLNMPVMELAFNNFLGTRINELAFRRFLGGILDFLPRRLS